MSRAQFGNKISGRLVKQLRILSNQTISTANGSVAQVVDLGELGAKSIQLVYNCNANANSSIYPCDNNGISQQGGLPLFSTSGSYLNNGVVCSELAGVRYLKVFVFDKTGIAGTVCNYVDLNWTVGV